MDWTSDTLNGHAGLQPVEAQARSPSNPCPRQPQLRSEIALTIRFT
jgi:hypothetical protein